MNHFFLKTYNKLIRHISTKKHVVSFIPGDGIGPEISESVSKIFEHIHVPIQFEYLKHISEDGSSYISQNVIDSLNRNKVGLKGPLATPIGKGHQSFNLLLRKIFKWYANVRPCKNIQGIVTGYPPINAVIIRENTEGEYCANEHMPYPGVVESIKLITRDASTRISEYAFDYATKNGFHRVTAVHKANIMKMSDGLFIKCSREVSQKYPSIKYEEVTLDFACTKMIIDPSYFEVLVMPNLYGDIMSDMASGLIGGLGLTPSGNIGLDSAMFEAVHGSANDIAGKNLANPTALLLSSVMMLRYLGFPSYADTVEKAIHATIKDGKNLTIDIGGKASCTEYTDTIIKNL